MNEQQRVQRQNKLDDAISEYMNSMMLSGEMESGIVSGWVVGVAVTHFGDAGTDIDGILVENSPNLNTFLARGLADATSERFQQNATGFHDEPEMD